MKNVLLFLVYATVIFAVLAGFSSVVWLPLLFLPTKAGFVIGAFITTVTVVITKLAIDNN